MKLSICRCCYSSICRFISNCTLALCLKSKFDIIISIGYSIGDFLYLQYCCFFLNRNVNAVSCSRMVRVCCHANGNLCFSGFQKLYISGAVYCQNFRFIACIGQCSVTSVLINRKCKIRISVSLFSDSFNRYLSGCTFYSQCTIHKANIIIRTCKSTGLDGISSNLAIVSTSCTCIACPEAACFYIITCKCECSTKYSHGILFFAIHKSSICGCIAWFVFAILNRLIICCYGQCSLFDIKLRTCCSLVITLSGNRHFRLGGIRCCIDIIVIGYCIIRILSKYLTTKHNGNSRFLCCSGINQIIRAGDHNASRT